MAPWSEQEWICVEDPCAELFEMPSHAALRPAAVTGRGGWPSFWPDDSAYFDVSGYGVGSLRAVTLRLEGEAEGGGSGALHLHSIQVTPAATGVTTTFP
jgi:hypothetical protein